MFSKISTQSMPILATYNPTGVIKIQAAALNENLGEQFKTHIVEQKDPRFVYAIARAVTADVPNKNHDLFPLDEIKRAYTTFIGRNIFLDHNTKSVRNAVGKIIAAELREDEEGHTYVACLFKIDRELHPDIARKIENGIIDSVSMGANVQNTCCNKCGNKAAREADFCLVPGTLIATKGFIYKPIEEIKVGDIVITHTGEERPVLKTFVRTVDEQVYTIKSSFNNREITATGNHPFGVATPTGIVWKEAKDLQIKDWLFQPKYEAENKTDENDNVDFAEWLGYYLSEGWTNNNGQTTGKPFNKLEFSVGVYEDTFITRLLELGKKFLGKEGKVYPSYSSSLGCSVRFIGENVGKVLFEYGGHRATTKCLSSKVFCWSNASKLALLHGFLEGDGTIARGGRAVSFSTSSYKLAYQFKKLFNDLGYPANVCSYVNSGGPSNRENTHTGYRVSLYGDNSEAFLRKEGSAIQFKHSNTPGFCFVWMNNYYFSIRDIEVSHYVGPVYNFEVAEHNSYIAEGVVVHNCDHQKSPYLYPDYYAINHGVEFTELSLVSVPADPTAHMHKVFNYNTGMTKNAVAPSPATDVNPEAGGQDAISQDDVSLEEVVESKAPPKQPVTEEQPVDAVIISSDSEEAKDMDKYYQVDCSSMESADFIYNIFSPFLNKGINELLITGKSIKVEFDKTVKDVEKFVQDIITMFGLQLGKGLVEPKVAALYAGLVKTATADYTEHKIDINTADNKEFQVTLKISTRSSAKNPVSLKVKSVGEPSSNELLTKVATVVRNIVFEMEGIKEYFTPEAKNTTSRSKTPVYYTLKPQQNKFTESLLAFFKKRITDIGDKLKNAFSEINIDSVELSNKDGNFQVSGQNVPANPGSNADGKTFEYDINSIVKALPDRDTVRTFGNEEAANKLYNILEQNNLLDIFENDSSTNKFITDFQSTNYYSRPIAQKVIEACKKQYNAKKPKPSEKSSGESGKESAKNREEQKVTPVKPDTAKQPQPTQTAQDTQGEESTQPEGHADAETGTSGKPSVDGKNEVEKATNKVEPKKQDTTEEEVKRVDTDQQEIIKAIKSDLTNQIQKLVSMLQKYKNPSINTYRKWATLIGDRLRQYIAERIQKATDLTLEKCWKDCGIDTLLKPVIDILLPGFKNEQEVYNAIKGIVSNQPDQQQHEGLNKSDKGSNGKHSSNGTQQGEPDKEVSVNKEPETKTEKQSSPATDVTSTPTTKKKEETKKKSPFKSGMMSDALKQFLDNPDNTVKLTPEQQEAIQKQYNTLSKELEKKYQDINKFTKDDLNALKNFFAQNNAKYLVQSGRFDTFLKEKAPNYDIVDLRNYLSGRTDKLKEDVYQGPDYGTSKPVDYITSLANIFTKLDSIKYTNKPADVIKKSIEYINKLKEQYQQIPEENRNLYQTTHPTHSLDAFDAKIEEGNKALKNLEQKQQDELKQQQEKQKERPTEQKQQKKEETKQEENKAKEENVQHELNHAASVLYDMYKQTISDASDNEFEFVVTSLMINGVDIEEICNKIVNLNAYKISRYQQLASQARSVLAGMYHLFGYTPDDPRGKDNKEKGFTITKDDLENAKDYSMKVTYESDPFNTKLRAVGLPETKILVTVIRNAKGNYQYEYFLPNYTSWVKSKEASLSIVDALKSCVTLCVNFLHFKIKEKLGDKENKEDTTQDPQKQENPASTENPADDGWNFNTEKTRG